MQLIASMATRKSTSESLQTLKSEAWMKQALLDGVSHDG
jgi:hypothetical protein